MDLLTSPETIAHTPGGAPPFGAPPGTPPPDVEVTVVMPCLNEALTVGRCVDKARNCLERLGVRHEIIVADNGSTDGSPELACAGGARVVHVERRGYGSALQAGISAARGRFIVMGDADDSYDFEHLGPFLEGLRQGDDLVMGNRFRGGIMPGAMPWLHRYVGNPILTGCLNLFFRTPIRDAHCGLRAFRKDSYERLGLDSPGMEFASEMVVKASLNGQVISEVPTTLHPDGRDRPPHLRSFHDGWRHLRLLLLLCPTWLYLVPAAALMTIGLALLAWLSPGPRAIGGVVFDLHSMLLGALCVLLAHQTLWHWACAKAHGVTTKTMPAAPATLWVLGRFNLERGLQAGVVLVALGLGLNMWVAYQWYGRGLGELQVQTTLRYALWGLTTMVLGMQMAYGSFLLSFLSMPSRPMRPR